jgi:predicted RND superfamily exporter protein
MAQIGLSSLQMQRSLTERIIRFSMRHARVMVMATFAASLVFGWFALRVRINPDFTSLLPRNADINRLLKEYGGGAPVADLLVFAVTAEGPGGVFAPERLAAYGEAVSAIAALTGVQAVISPFNLGSFGRENGRLAIRPMSPSGAVPQPGAVEEFRVRLTGTRYARNLVVSSDATMLISYIQTESLGSFRSFMDKVDAIAAGMRAKGLTPYVTGTIPLSVRTEFHLSRDATRLLALAAFIILLSYVAGFRSLRAVRSEEHTSELQSLS